MPARAGRSQVAPDHSSEARRRLFPSGRTAKAFRQPLGNQALQRLLGSGAIRAKLTVSQPGDPYEQEADRVAEQVLRQPGRAAPVALHSGAPDLLPKCEECASGEGLCPECAEEEETVQRKEAAGGARDNSPSLASQVTGFRHGGQPLPRPVRAFFEPRFGRDFGHVRIHTDARAADSARELNARAYTIGPSIIFASGQFAPAREEGRLLLAHELAHVLQRSDASVIRRQPASTVEYQVMRGDTLSEIAQRFNTTVDELTRLNNLRGAGIRAGQRIQVPAGAAGCGITVPSSANEQVLAGAIFAEAVPAATDNTEREAIGWCFVNAARHTRQLCENEICPALRPRDRERQCRSERTNLGSTILQAVRIGSAAHGGSRWAMVMSGNSMLPAANLCQLPASEISALTRAITAAQAVNAGTATARSYLRFNQAPNSPPSPRMQRAAAHGAHTFYRFISGRECG